MERMEGCSRFWRCIGMHQEMSRLPASSFDHQEGEKQPRSRTLDHTATLLGLAGKPHKYPQTKISKWKMYHYIRAMLYKSLCLSKSKTMENPIHGPWTYFSLFTFWNVIAKIHKHFVCLTEEYLPFLNKSCLNLTAWWACFWCRPVDDPLLTATFVHLNVQARACFVTSQVMTSSERLPPPPLTLAGVVLGTAALKQEDFFSQFYKMRKARSADRAFFSSICLAWCHRDSFLAASWFWAKRFNIQYSWKRTICQS